MSTTQQLPTSPTPPAAAGGPAEPRSTPSTAARGGSAPGLVLSSATALSLLLLLPVFGSLLTDGGWVLPSVLAVVGVVVTGGLLRQTRLPIAFIPLAQLAAFLVTQALWFRGAEGVPDEPPLPWLLEPLSGYRDTLLLGLETSRDTVAPTASTAGLSALIAIGVFIVALLVETLTVGLGHAALAGIVLLVAVLVPSGILPEGVPLLALAGLALGWLLLIAADQSTRMRAAGSRRRPESWAWTGATALLTVVTLTATGALGILVAAESGPTWVRSLNSGWQSGTGDGLGPGASVDPFVDVQNRLASGSTVELLRYEIGGEARSQYLRLVTLPVAQGSTWTPVDPVIGDNVSVSQRYPNQPFGALSSTTITTRELENPYLPAPLFATRITGVDDTRWSWDESTGDAVSTQETASGQDYTVEAYTPDPEPAQLAASASTPSLAGPGSVDVPAGLSPLVAQTAQEVTAGTESNYERALALQEYFTDGQFQYSVTIPATGERDAYEAFLTDQVGFCQQFASTMAIMARTLGIPARVTVGFTAGLRDFTGEYSVRGIDAHAWPELWFDDVGWVRFEPTPSSENASIEPPLYAAQGSQTPDSDRSEPDELPEPTSELPPEDTEVPDSETLTSTDGGLPSGLGWVGSVVLIGMLAVVTLPWLVRRLRRLVRLRVVQHRGDPVAAWAEVLDTARDRGITIVAADTPAALGRRLGQECAFDAATQLGLDRLVGQVEAAFYDPAWSADQQSRAGSGRVADLRLVLRAIESGTAQLRLSQRWFPASLRGREQRATSSSGRRQAGARADEADAASKDEQVPWLP